MIHLKDTLSAAALLKERTLYLGISSTEDATPA
jgi:hypothetical protein